MRFAGIDVASQTHVVAIVDERGEILVKPASFGEDAAGYEKLFAVLGRAEDILVALEATGHYGSNLLAALYENGFTSCLLNPVRTHRFALEDLTRAKTDSIDALGIARFAAQKRPLPTPPIDAATGELREIVRVYDRIRQDHGNRIRQLHRVVDLCFPEFTRHVIGLDSRRATAILRAFPTAKAFTDASADALAGLRCGRYPVGRDRALVLIQAAKTSVGRHHGPVYHTETQYLCDDIDVLRQRLEYLKNEIERRIALHPVARLLTTIDGLGALTAAHIVAAVGDPARFRNGAALAAYAGVVPGTKLSGLRSQGHASLCPIGNARLRRSLYMTTLGTIQRNPWLRSTYERLRGRGKPAKVAISAAMRKLLLAVYSVAKSKKPFVPRMTSASE